MDIKILHNKCFRVRRSENSYGSFSPFFALGKRVKNTVKPISHFVLCRETLGSSIRRRINCNTIDTKILNLLVWFLTPDSIKVLKNGEPVYINNAKKDYLEYVTSEHDKSIHRALHVLNVIEKELGWRKTVIKKVNHCLSNRHNLYLFIASPRWILAPPLLSLYTLIIRSGTFKNISKIKSIDELSTAYSKTTKEHVLDLDQVEDVVLLKEIASILKDFLININKIYKGRNRKMNFSTDVFKSNYNAFNEGITKLVKGNTCDTFILERFRKYTHK